MKRGGATFDAKKDEKRLDRQHAHVWHVMRDGRWHTLADIERRTSHPQASISARLRDFRKKRFGSHEVQRERDGWVQGLFHYRLVVNAGGEDEEGC
jgi:hypothetical protein